MTDTNKFDDSSFPVDGPWFTTYSRALCSVYPNEEDHCWDRLAHSHSVFIKSPVDEGSPIASSNLRTSGLLERSLSGTTLSQRAQRQRKNNRLMVAPFQAPPETTTLAETSMAFADRGQAANAGTHSDVDELPLMSPGLFSHALCKIGFYCIDYLTATSDEEQAFPNRCVSVDPKLQEDDFGADWRTDLAAAVCGKRTAALERKRVRSRTMNQDHLASYGMTRDPWFDTLDRLSRWDEVARK